MDCASDGVICAKAMGRHTKMSFSFTVLLLSGRTCRRIAMAMGLGMLRWRRFILRQGGDESTDGIGDACDGEGKGKPLFGELHVRVGRLSAWWSHLAFEPGRNCQSFSLGELAGGLKSAPRAER